MGGVAVLHPQDYLNDNNHDNLFLTPVIKSRRNPKSIPNIPRSDGRKRSPPTVRKNKSPATMVTDPPVSAAGKHLVMGQVKILKRGEPLDQSSTVVKETSVVTSRVIDNDVSVGKKAAMQQTTTTMKKKKKTTEKEKRSFLKNDDFALSTTDRLGPDPEMVPKQMNEFFFAGSAFVDSPPPSSVPIPGFFTKSFAVKDDPSSDLRRILGLSLS